MYNTEKIELRPFTEEYVSLYHSWRNDMEVMKYDQPGFLYPISYEEVSMWHERVTSNKKSHSFIIIEKSTQKAIGICALLNIDYKNRNLEMSIVIGEKEFWSKGFGKDTMRLLIKIGFEELNMHKLYLRVMSFNKRAIGMYEKLGFMKEGTLKETIYRNGTYHDTLYYAMFRKDYTR